MECISECLTRIVEGGFVSGRKQLCITLANETRTLCSIAYLEDLMPGPARACGCGDLYGDSHSLVNTAGL